MNSIEDIAIKMMKIEKIGRLNYDQIFYIGISHIQINGTKKCNHQVP